MKKIVVVACLLASIAFAGPLATHVRADALGELCWSLKPVANPLFGDTSTLRLALSSAGSGWLLNGRWVYFTGGDLDPGRVTSSVAVAGAMARDVAAGGLDITLDGHDFADSTDPSREFSFHAKIDTDTGNGTWARSQSNGTFLTGTITLLSSCPLLGS
jgi:hypothetical protein